MAAAERSGLEDESEKEEKEPKVKCHEMRLIFQRLPTYELIRFISNQSKHPLGKFWSQELKFVIENRLPFSVKATGNRSGPSCDHVIFDCNGSRVAEIKRPGHFHLSPICELIESAVLLAITPYDVSVPPRFVFPTPDILSSLTNLETLVLSTRNVPCRNLPDPVDLSAALNPEVMSRIKSLTLVCSDYGCLAKPLLEIISRATSLKKLSVPYVDLSSQSSLAALPPDLPGHYSSLESLSIKRLVAETAQPLFEVITSRFNGLRVLFLPVDAPVRQYLAAFQALPSLATLGLTIYRFESSEAEKRFAVDEDDAPVVSVTELLIVHWSFEGKLTRAVLATLSKFPNVRTFGADFGSHVTDFASSVCAGGVFRHLQALKLVCCGSSLLTRDALLQFVSSNINLLPSSVDLSQVETARPTTVDRDFLVDLCTTLQGGRLTSLALKDLVHREALPRLREHFASAKQDKSTPQAKVGKVLAWIDEGSIDERRIRSRAAWWPEAVSDFTDFRFEACKTLGPLKRSPFKVRISDWTEKRDCLFDV